jgi:hypothetical protein
MSHRLRWLFSFNGPLIARFFPGNSAPASPPGPFLRRHRRQEPGTCSGWLGRKARLLKAGGSRQLARALPPGSGRESQARRASPIEVRRGLVGKRGSFASLVLRARSPGRSPRCGGACPLLPFCLSTFAIFLACRRTLASSVAEKVYFGLCGRGLGGEGPLGRGATGARRIGASIPAAEGACPEAVVVVRSGGCPERRGESRLRDWTALPCLADL